MACIPGDFGCYLGEVVALLAPWVFVIVLLLVAIFILPKAGYKGVVVSIVIIFLILWWFGFIPGVPRLGQYFGMTVFTRG